MEKGARDRADMSLPVSVRIHRVTYGILPCVRITSHSQTASTTRSVRSFTKRRTVIQIDRKSEEGKGNVAIVRIAKNWGCACQEEVENHTFLQMAQQFHAVPSTTCQLFSQVFRADPRDPVRHLRLLHLHHPTQRDRNQRRDQQEKGQKRNRRSVRGNSDQSAEEKDGDNLVRGNLGQPLPEWLQEFTEHLVDREDSVQEPAVSQELRISEPPPKVKTGMHNVFTHFPKDQHREVCRSRHGTAMFQGTVERVTKEPAVLAPSTMNFPVAAPPE